MGAWLVTAQGLEGWFIVRYVPNEHANAVFALIYLENARKSCLGPTKRVPNASIRHRKTAGWYSIDDAWNRSPPNRVKNLARAVS